MNPEKFNQIPVPEYDQEKMKKYEDAKGYLSGVFEGNDEIRKKVYEEIRLTSHLVGLDPEETIGKITEWRNGGSREEFVSKSFELLKELIDKRIENPELFERMHREIFFSRSGNIKLSELMYFNVINGDTAMIHIAPKGENMGISEIIRAFRLGMVELAKQVAVDDKIKEILATSWIVAANPGLLEKAGFTIGGEINEKTKIEHFNHETRPVSWASMSREVLLEKYLPKNV
jgi:hypothetical protein